MDYIFFLLHEIGIGGDQQARIYLRAEASFGEVNCLTVYLGQLDAILVLGKVETLVCLDEMAVVDLSQFLIVEVLNEEVDHFFILFLDGLDLVFLLDFLLVLRSIDDVDLIDLLRHQFPIPADEEVITVEVGTADLGRDWDIARFREDDAVYKLSVDVF
jgi:hypothetical protein